MNPGNTTPPAPKVRGTAKTLIVAFALAGALVVLGLLLAAFGNGWWRWTTWAGLTLLTATTLYGWLWGAPVPPPAPGPEGTKVATAQGDAVSTEGGSHAVRWLADHLEPLFAWVVAYPLFPLEIALFWAISWFDFGGGLGVPDLVWGSEWWMRLWVGVAVSMLFGSALFIRALLDRRPGSTPPSYFDTWPSLFLGVRDPVTRKVGAFVTWLWLGALVIFYAPVVREDWVFAGDGVPGMMLLGLLAGVAVTAVAVAVFERSGLSGRWQSTSLFRRMPGFRGDPPAIPGGDRALHATGVLCFVLPAVIGAALLFEYLRYNAVWSPVWLFCLVLGLFNAVYGFLTYHLAGLQYMLALLAAAAVFVSNVNNTTKMTLPGLEDEYDKPLDQRVKLDERPPGEPPAGLLETRDMLATFTQKRGKDGQKPKLVVVATTGGGIQAAVWTAIVLEALEKNPELAKAGFRDHIRLITGASGGMQAAALYAADFERPKRLPDTPLHRQLARDSLWPTAQTMLFNDVPGAFWPKRLTGDRGRRLEEAWERNCTTWWNPDGSACDPPNWFRDATGVHYYDPDSPLKRTFADLLTLEKECGRPSLVFSPMLVEDCRRVMISNLAMDWFTRTEVSNLNPGWGESAHPPAVSDATVSVPAIEFWRYFPNAHGKFKVGTAARMNATFPFVGPAVSLPTNPPRRVVDAGYFDNFGLNFTAMWLHHYKKQIAEHTSGVIVIEVRAYPRREEKLRFAQIGKDGEAQPESFNWAFAEVSSPLEAIYNLYARSAYFRNDQLMHLLDESFNAPVWQRRLPWVRQRDSFFNTVTFECTRPAALSWTLPKQHYNELQAVFEPSEARLGELLRNTPDDEKKAITKSREQSQRTTASLQEWFGTGRK